MKEHSEEETELRSYLLGELTLEERVLIEERLFLDGDYLQLSRAVEDELVDDYAHHELKDDEQEKFETHFLIRPEHREGLRIAQALKRFTDLRTEAVEPAPAPVASDPAPGYGNAPRVGKERRDSFLLSLFRRPALGFSLAAVLLLLAVITWFAVGSRREPGTHPPMEARRPAPQQTVPEEQQQREATGDLTTNGRGSDDGAEVADGRESNQGATKSGGTQGARGAGLNAGRPRGASRPTGRTATRVVAVLLLPGGIGRGEGAATVVPVSSDVGTVILKLPLVNETDYPSYRATLQTGGRTVRAFADLKSETDAEHGRVVPLKIPARLLRRQTYRIKISGVTTTGQTDSLSSHTFQVERK